jgi:hypothetical protein
VVKVISPNACDLASSDPSASTAGQEGTSPSSSSSSPPVPLDEPRVSKFDRSRRIAEQSLEMMAAGATAQQMQAYLGIKPVKVGRSVRVNRRVVRVMVGVLCRSFSSTDDSLVPVKVEKPWKPEPRVTPSHQFVPRDEDGAWGLYAVGRL